MSAELLPVWHEIEKYIDDGISVIPVRDKDDEFGVAKSPFGKSWKEYQKRIIERNVLFELMDVKYNTTAVGIVGGLVSGNLEIIDIDVKYKPGIDALLFTDLKILYPELLVRLRIHITPSGGRHILYRCEVPVPGNQKLAGTKDANGKSVNFLETRGEGGYVLAPPAMGYAVAQDVPIPILTAIERESIIGLCRSYNEIIKVEAPPRPTQSDIQYYDTNPFDDFNNRVDPRALMLQLGWTEYKANNNFIWFTRPDKVKGVSLSFNLATRFFYCFTASTELEESKGYRPANLLATLQFNNDKKKLYAYLVLNGYGKIKRQVEARIIKAAVMNESRLPSNISPEAISDHATFVATSKELHPFGTFWIDSSKNGVQIDREKLYGVADKLGFKLYNGTLIQSDGKYIEKITDRNFYDQVKAYIKEEDADLYRDICNAYEAFIEKHGGFTISRMPIIQDDQILKDTKDAAFKVYKNGILKITSESIELLPSVSLLIWRTSLKTRPYTSLNGGRYLEFLRLAINLDTLFDYILLIIGYLAHEYKDETAGYIIVLTEECENPKDGGGAGKNVFSEMFKHITSFVSKPGSQVKYDEKFMQSWNGEKIFCLSDVPKNFNFSFLKELSTGTGLMKKLFKDEVGIQSSDMPKFLIQTNYSYKISDGGLRRRIRAIEFTDFFTKAGGVNKHFGGVYFPNEWNAEDWAGFDTLIATSVNRWLMAGRNIPEAVLSQTGWLKQFEQDHGEVLAFFIEENINKWLSAEFVVNAKFNEDIEKYLIECKATAKEKERFTSFKINEALRDYCKKKGIHFLNNVNNPKSTSKEKGRKFLLTTELPFGYSVT